MGLMEREYMREDYKKESSCKRWNGKAERKRNYIDSINFDSLSINKDIEPTTYIQTKKTNINLQKKRTERYNFIRTFTLFFIIGFILFFVINFCMNNTIIF